MLLEEILKLYHFSAGTHPLRRKNENPTHATGSFSDNYRKIQREQQEINGNAFGRPNPK
jgi:hypothetical protein